jgi:hypothetical protein
MQRQFPKKAPLSKLATTISEVAHFFSRSSRSTVFLSFLCNQQPLLSPVSIFLTNATCLSLCKGQKCFAERFGDDDFQGGSPLVMVLHQDSFSQFSWQPWPMHRGRRANSWK